MAELIWKGKYDADGQRVQPVYTAVPLRTLEYLGEADSAAHNRLIHGDRLGVLAALLPELRGQVDLIYLDPPFATGHYFRMSSKAAEAHTRIAYEDTWADEDEYLHWLYETLTLARDLLRETGSLYLHLAHHMSAYARLLLDEVFGQECFQNEIIWCYRTGGASRRRFARKHDNIFFYSRSPQGWTFHSRKERSYMQHRYGFPKSDFQFDEQTGQQFSLVYPRDVWDIAAVGSATLERVGYPTQKPEALLERIMRASSNEGDLVLDCFSGSGTTAAVAHRLKRRWIVGDASTMAVNTTRQRMVLQCASFVLQTLEDTAQNGEPG